MVEDDVLILDEAEPPIVDRVLRGLKAFNEGQCGPSNKMPLVAQALIEGQPADAGLVGYTAWGWLFTEKLWVADALRGRGLAGKLLTAAEGEAVRRGAKGGWLDTFNPKARMLYERLGYEVCGEIPDFVAGRSRYFMKKLLR